MTASNVPERQPHDHRQHRQLERARQPGEDLRVE